jgi:hypothetical protein
LSLQACLFEIEIELAFDVARDLIAQAVVSQLGERGALVSTSARPRL